MHRARYIAFISIVCSCAATVRAESVGFDPARDQVHSQDAARAFTARFDGGTILPRGAFERAPKLTLESGLGLPSLPESASLLALACGSVGVWQLGRKYSIGGAPSWYADTAPASIGHITRLDPSGLASMNFEPVMLESVVIPVGRALDDRQHDIPRAPVFKPLIPRGPPAA